MKNFIDEFINKGMALTVGFLFVLTVYQFFTINTALEYIGFAALVFFPFRKVVRVFYRDYKTM